MTVGETESRPQMLVDIEAIEKVYGCKISRVDIGRMLIDVSRRYRPGINFEDLLESVVYADITLNDGQRHAYKFVLGKEFWRRKQRKDLLKDT